jgi:glutamine---fructose-6-phosphate transaminase (isomerizing)
MCGIVGYAGQRQAQPILINCLEKLEYRGYDSCGIALSGENIQVFKDAGRVASLSKSMPIIPGSLGTGHTRWATHGPPNRTNAHPHSDCTGKITVVHNGVINNYLKLRYQLLREGHKMVSETDTEVIPHLIEKYYRGDIEAAVSSALKDLEGSYAIIVMAEGSPGLVFAKKDSPLIIGLGDRENLIASDVTAVLEYTNRVIYLEDGDMGTITDLDVKIKRDGQELKREIQRISWSSEQSQKGGYQHFMLKEIHEQPRVIRDTLAEYMADPGMSLEFGRPGEKDRSMLLLACGTSYNAALVGKYINERLQNIPVRAEVASEYNYLYNRFHCQLVIGVTQSGETADTLKAMRLSKEVASRIVAITNVVGSTASKIANHTVFTRAGPEISVAATKTFIAELVALYWLAISGVKKEQRERADLIRGFRQLPDKVQQILDQEEAIARYAIDLAAAEHVFYIGRGINYPIAREGALKLKEISYVHAEAFAGGEIKHGPFALLSQSTPVVALLAHDNSYEAMLTSIKEIKARGSPVCVISGEEDEMIHNLADYVITVPPVEEIFSPFINTVVVQLLAYYAAKARNCPIDNPRNLAKSVTVE